MVNSRERRKIEFSTEAEIYLSFCGESTLSDVSSDCCICVIWFDSKPSGAEILSHLIIEGYSSWVYKWEIMSALTGYWHSVIVWKEFYVEALMFCEGTDLNIWFYLHKLAQSVDNLLIPLLCQEAVGRGNKPSEFMLWNSVRAQGCRSVLLKNKILSFFRTLVNRACSRSCRQDSGASSTCEEKASHTAAQAAYLPL